ncbi:MAG: hypothetical protein AABY04_04145 [Candidatus Micrarchaeota archaeon]
MESIKRQRQARFEEIKHMDLPGVRSRAILSVFEHRMEQQRRIPNSLEERFRKNLEIRKSSQVPIRSEKQSRLLGFVSQVLESKNRSFRIERGQIPQNQQLSPGELLRMAQRNRRAKLLRR